MRWCATCWPTTCRRPIAAPSTRGSPRSWRPETQIRSRSPGTGWRRTRRDRPWRGWSGPARHSAGCTRSGTPQPRFAGPSTRTAARCVDRVAVLERLAECSELSGAIGEAARTWETAAAMRSASGDTAASAQDRRRRARALEVQGRWKRAVDARLAAAEAFAAAGAAAESAVERLAAAAHLRSAASFSAALEILAVARADAVAAERPDLEARAMGLEGNVLARMGQAEAGLELVRRGLSRCARRRRRRRGRGALPAPRRLARARRALRVGARRLCARGRRTAGPSRSSRSPSCAWPAWPSCCGRRASGPRPSGHAGT